MKLRKKLSLVLALILTLSTVFADSTYVNAAQKSEKKPIEILFIGNSLTHRNSLPGIFTGIAEANDVDVNATPLACSSYYLSDFADPTNDYGKNLRTLLTNNSYDYVVIQAQSSEAIRMYNSSTIPSASTLAALIRDNGAEPIMYMTWGLKDTYTYTHNGEEVTLDNAAMTNALAEAYFRMGNEINAKVAPAGINFKRFRDLFPETELYDDDGKHPSYIGSYLAACSIYNTIFSDYQFSDNEEENLAKQTCLGCPYYASEDVDIPIIREEAENCQMIADCQMTGNASYVSIPIKGKSTFKATLHASEFNEFYAENYAGKDKITYSSLDDSIVSIDKDTGKFKGEAVGITQIKATSSSGLTFMQTVQVRQPATGITLSETEFTLFAGDTKKLTANVLPANTTDKSIKWITSDETIATVDNNGLITAVNTGNVTIKARAHNGYTAEANIKIILNTPANFTAKNTTSTKGDNYTNIVLNWDLVNKANRYIVYRSTSKTGSYKKIATVDTNTYTDENVKCGTTYFYKVYASCGVLEFRSDSSTIISYLTPAKATLNSAKRTKASKKKYIKLKWTSQSNANGYMIYRANTRNGKYKLIKTITSNSKVTFTDKTTKKKKNYYYKICAYANNNVVKTCGAFSEKVRVKKAK